MHEDTLSRNDYVKEMPQDWFRDEEYNSAAD